MKKIKPFLVLCTLVLLLTHCKKAIVETSIAPSSTAPLSTNAAAAAVFETVISSSSFSSYTALETDWNYLYPWGSDHNGSARMYGSSTDHNHVYLDASGVLHIKAARITWDEGTSTSTPHLAIHYHSGA